MPPSIDGKRSEEKVLELRAAGVGAQLAGVSTIDAARVVTTWHVIGDRGASGGCGEHAEGPERELLRAFKCERADAFYSAAFSAAL